MLTSFARDDEIKQIWNIIDSEKKNTYVFRTDIKSFFESVPFESVIEDLFSHNYISVSVYKHLKNINTFSIAHGYRGLPRGLPISSSLCEYALRSFDKKVWGMSGCLYYTRYVDDIVLFTTEYVKDIKADIENNYLPYGLKLNRSKTSYELIGTEKSIEYLGYSFPLNDVKRTTISIKKINKVKRRIMLALNAYVNVDHDFSLLLDRLRFLSGNTALKVARRKTILKVGFKYQYMMCDKVEIIEQLKKLDTYLKSILYSKKYSLSKKVKRMLSGSEYKQLLELSFVSGYTKNIKHYRSKGRISKIKDAWRYE